ncbi:lipase 3-like [Aphomia sociella]
MGGRWDVVGRDRGLLADKNRGLPKRAEQLFVSSRVVDGGGSTAIAPSRLPETIVARERGAYSSDIYEDALLDVPDLIERYGYPVEVHNVITSDNYVLEAHRIPHGRDQNNQRDSNKPVVFIMHGLFSSSADFLLMGPERALAYILADAGYDVWLGNARGNYYSRENLVLNPDDRRNLDFWRFSWDEIGNLDLPAYIDYILELTGQSKLHYVGYSQGTTVFLVLTSLRPEYNDKIHSFHAMAPAAFNFHNEEAPTNVLSQYEGPLEAILFGLGFGELLRKRPIITWFAFNFCADDAIYHELCVRLLLGNDSAHINGTLLPLFLAHTPAGASARQIIHYAQCANSKDFRRYSHLPIRNIEIYGRPVPPSYDLEQITVPVYIHYSLGDLQSDYRDVYYLSERLPNVAGMYQVDRQTFTHMDFVWGVDAKEQLYDKIVSLMQEVDANSK